MNPETLLGKYGRKMVDKTYWKNRRVLVTGHEGFLGSWLTKRLLELDAHVVGIDKVVNKPRSILDSLRKNILGIKGDISNLKLVTRVIDQYRPQSIFHLAAEAIVDEATSDPIEAFKSNIEGTWNILEASRAKSFIEAIITASSDKAYGAHKKLPYRENTPLCGEHPYDVSKSCADLLCYAYYKTYHVPVCVTRCGNIYGPGDFHFSRIVPDSIRSIFKRRQLVIRSDGKFTRDYVYIKDIVRAYLILAQKIKRLKLYGQSFNFSNEKPIKVLNLYQQIVKLCGRNGKKAIKPRILNRAHFEIRHQYLSSQKARRVLNWKPQYNLKNGLRETIDWYKQNLKG